MKKIAHSLIFTVFLFLTQKAACESALIEGLPKEALVLKLPNNEASKWKEISRDVVKKEGLVEVIPSGQTIQNWSELITIQYFHRSAMKENAADSVEFVVDQIKETILGSYPGCKVTWKIIQKNEKDVLYEWILHEPYKNIPPQHEIARGFLNDTGFHRVGFTRKCAEMSSEEREKWIQLFKGATCVVPWEEASKSCQTLSLIDKFQNSIELGPIFSNWKLANLLIYNDGMVTVDYISPIKTEGILLEILQVIILPNFDELSIDKEFELTKNFLEDKEYKRNLTLKNLKFKILAKSPTQIVYSHCLSRDKLQTNVVTRALTANQRFCSFIYKKCLLNKKMTEKEIVEWKEKLETISFRN